MAECMPSKFDTPGLLSGSKDTFEIMSVVAFCNFSFIESGESKRSILLLPEVHDFDIFAVGSNRFLILEELSSTKMEFSCKIAN